MKERVLEPYRIAGYLQERRVHARERHSVRPDRASAPVAFCCRLYRAGGQVTYSLSIVLVLAGLALSFGLHSIHKSGAEAGELLRRSNGLSNTT